jgi:NAD(P)-dependent dehydrogenase (short-subunit alcohol dehydrogenase family)
MQVDLHGKTALVTGAAHGIGRAIALALAANGADVAVNDLPDAGQGTVEEVRGMGKRAVFLPADVSKQEEVEPMVAAAEREFGAIDILVNNAGLNTPGPKRRKIYEYDAAEWHRVLGVDLHGMFYCCRAATPRMVERKSGVVVNIASTMGLVPSRMQSAYVSAKAAVVNFTRSMALELGGFGIRVNAIAPGSTLTRGTRALFYNEPNKQQAESLLSHVPLGRPGEPEEIASAALFLASPDASYITGIVLAVDGGWTAGYTRDW